MQMRTKCATAEANTCIDFAVPLHAALRDALVQRACCCSISLQPLNTLAQDTLIRVFSMLGKVGVQIEVFDYSLAETASILQTSVGAVKSALHRARGRIALPDVPGLLLRHLLGRT